MALHTSIRQGDIDQLKEILKGKVNLNEKDEHKRTALHVSASTGNVEIFQLLSTKAKKLDINGQDDRCWTPLHHAASKGCFALCQHLLSLKNIKPSVFNEDHATPFLLLCKLSLDTSEGSDSVFMFYRTLSAFVARGIDLNERNKNGDAALHFAVRCGNVEAVDFLCRHGAEINITNKANETPLLLAVQGRRHENVRCLLEFGASLTFANHDYNTLNQQAGTQIIKLMLTELFTLDQVTVEKTKELQSARKKLERDKMLLEELDRTLKKEEKKSGSGVHVRTTRNQSGGNRTKYQKTLLQHLKVCERSNALFYLARSGPWICCMKRIECSNASMATKTCENLQIMTEINHPNLLPVLMVSRSHAAVNVFVSRPSMTLTEILRMKKELLGPGKQLPVADIVEMALQIALPLEMLHKQQIVCRNIKADQIFTIMKDKRKIGPLMIPGYYACRTNSIWSVHSKNTEYYEPAYTIATESRLNSLSFCYTSDIWSFGVVLFEMLTFRAPYSHVSSKEQIAEYMKMQSPIIPRSLRPVSKGPHVTSQSTSSLYENYKLLVDIITLCTDIDPVKRPTITEIVYSLQNAVDIYQVVEKKLYAPQTTVELGDAILLQRNEWPPKPPGGSLPFHMLPKLTNSPMIKQCEGYIIEAPLHKNSEAQNPAVIQFLDASVPYYKNSLAFKLHENYIGASEHGQMVVISISTEGNLNETSSLYEVRAIIWAKERTERILVTCESLKDRFKNLKQHPALFPYRGNLQLVKETSIVKELIEFEVSQLETKCYKFGVVYCRTGQTTDDEMYSNENGSPEFKNFLNFLGSRVLLEGWDKFRGGLDVTANSTGTQSVYTVLEDMEIMFHVSTMLPFDQGNSQQVHRKRHIGNDIVVLVFQDFGSEPFVPSKWTSNFNHVFVIIQPTGKADKQGKLLASGDSISLFEEETTSYKVSIVYKDSISLHPRPFLTEPCVYKADEVFQKFLLTKLINCERASMRSLSFEKRLHHVRKQLLEAICSNRKKLKRR